MEPDNLLHPTTPAEQLIWKTIKQDKQAPSNTLSYCFIIKKKLTLDKVQRAIFRLLKQYAPSFNFRFVEYNGILYKQYFLPSLTPVRLIASHQSREKILFSEPLIPLYQFRWEAGETNCKLIAHLSHLIF